MRDYINSINVYVCVLISVAVSLPLSLSVCACVHILSRAFFCFFCQECVWQSCSHFPSGAVQEGWLVGRLHRKGNSLYQTADGGQHVLTLQKHTHTYTQARTHTHKSMKYGQTQ